MPRTLVLRWLFQSVDQEVDLRSRLGREIIQGIRSLTLRAIHSSRH